MAETGEGKNVQTFYLEINGIKIQKDEYETQKGRMGETEFWRSNENAAEVLQFKRAIVNGTLYCDDWTQDFQLIVSLRAGYVRVRVEKNFITSAQEVYQYLQKLIGAAYRVPGNKPEGALLRLTTQDENHHVLCTTYDPHWFVATMHEIKDEKVYRLPLAVI